MSFSAFEHSLIELLKEQTVEDTYTLACSGGLDSVTLLHCLLKIQPVFKFNLKVLHVHHGESLDKPEQSLYRNKTAKFVEDLAKDMSLDFKIFKSKVFLNSEEDCRDFRLQAYKGSENVLTAHHKDDYLETLMLRMIRGAGPQGLSEPFKEKNLKPFLNTFSRSEIKKYADLEQLNWCDDPSNQNSDPLRNWLRNKWIPDLDNKIGKDGFQRSLLLMSRALPGSDHYNYDEMITLRSDKEGCFLLKDWLVLDKFQKQSMIAHVLLKVRKTGYTHGQIEEVVKQLDQIKKETTFRSGKLEWIKSESKVVFRLDL